MLGKTDTCRILVDLKPALDGYEGIPQETRLLFRTLRTMAGCDVEGLIQHGGRRLRLDELPASKQASASSRADRISRFIVSLHEAPHSSIFRKVSNVTGRLLAGFLLRLRILTGAGLVPRKFEPAHVADFIWDTFFSKTLGLQDKDLVTGARYRVFELSRKLFHRVGLSGLRVPYSGRYIPIDTRDFDVFLAQTPFPARVSKNTRMVVRYHDAVPILMAHTIKDKSFHQASHFRSLQDNVRSGAWFSCISEATRKDLLTIFPEAEPKAVVIHNIVSDQYFDEPSSRNVARAIIRNRLAEMDQFATDMSSLQVAESGASADFRYLLIVSTIEPRKNHMLLLNAWKRLKTAGFSSLKLVVVGSIGWRQKEILDAFSTCAKIGELFYINNLPASDLRRLYRHAEATVCPSLSEGFGYSGVEAMCSGGIVIASDIPVHREIYGAAAEYFSPYSFEEAADAICRVVGEDGANVRDQLRREGSVVCKQYQSRALIPKWDSLFNQLRHSK